VIKSRPAIFPASGLLFIGDGMRRTVTRVVRSETGQQVCNAARPKPNRFTRWPRSSRRKVFPGAPPADASSAPAWFANPPALSAPTFLKAGPRPAGCGSAPANPGLLPAFAAEAPARAGLVLTRFPFRDRGTEHPNPLPSRRICVNGKKRPLYDLKKQKSAHE